MKYICIIGACILFVFLFSGCSPKKEAAPMAVSSEFKTADQLIQEAESREEQENTSRAEQLYGKIAGAYFCRSQEINEQFWPSLELTLDGKAIFHANLLTSMGSLEGHYEYVDDTVKLSVEAVSFTGFAGEKVTDMVFQVSANNSLILSYTTPDTAVGISVSGDVFEKNG